MHRAWCAGRRACRQSLAASVSRRAADQRSRSLGLEPRSFGAAGRETLELGLDARTVDNLPESVAAADIVTCATLATEPVVRGGWLAPGSHLDLIGSFTPAMREADDACFANAQIFVDTAEAFQKSGDLLGPLQRKVIADSERWPTLETLCRGEAQGRTAGAQRTVYKAVGSALEDLAAAVLVHERCERASA